MAIITWWEFIKAAGHLLKADLRVEELGSADVAGAIVIPPLPERRQAGLELGHVDGPLAHEDVEHLLPRELAVALRVDAKEPAIWIFRDERHRPVAVDGRAALWARLLVAKARASCTQQLLRA